MDPSIVFGKNKSASNGKDTDFVHFDVLRTEYLRGIGPDYGKGKRSYRNKSINSDMATGSVLTVSFV